MLRLALSRAIGVALALSLGSLVFSGEALASLRCEEMQAARVCTDGAPHDVTTSGGARLSVPAPIIPGFTTACWNWSRKFQCIETTPILSCQSGAAFSTVKNKCSLISASINATLTVRSLTYITDASYEYMCDYGEWETDDTLPAGKQCVLLSSTVTDDASVAAAAAGTAPSSGSGTPPTTANLNTTIVESQTRTDHYVCYSAAETTCADTCYEQQTDPATGTTKQVAVPCTSPVSNCVTTASQCNGVLNKEGGYVSGDIMVGPDGRCIEKITQQICQNGFVPRCLTADNCQLANTTETDILDNGVAKTQEQTYICTNETKTCTKYSSLSSCVHANAWGFDKFTFAGNVGDGLGDASTAMARIEGIQKGLGKGDLYIFSGQNLRCHYAIGNFLNTFITIAVIVVLAIISGGAGASLLGSALESTAYAAMDTAAIGGAMEGSAIIGQTALAVAENANMIANAISIGSSAYSDAKNSKAFGSDCCKEYVIEGSDSWFRFGACTADEVRLAVARRKNLTHYLGDYCSKKSGFPVRQCVEKTKSYCVFDDMLALVVNEQGRAQLDQIAAADPVSTKSTPEGPFELFAPMVPTSSPYKTQNTGHWVKLLTEQNSQLWYWQYPGYCISPTVQNAAYIQYSAELDQLLSMQGIQPTQMTPAQAYAYLSKTLTIIPFQECASTPGTISFLTCSLTDDNCNTSKLPEGPTGVETDMSGAEISDADVNWRIQQVTSFHQPGDYGVTATMATDNSFAAVAKSVSEYITSIGSCHENGDCLYRFSITDKKSARSTFGAKKTASDSTQFPLYTIAASSAYPSIDYLGVDGTFNQTAWQADPNRGVATPFTVGTQRFIFRPNFITTKVDGQVHTKVLMEYANHNTSTQHPQDDYIPLLVPTDLPEATPGWWPYGDPNNNGAHFYLSGKCDPNSKWCNYTVQVDLSIPRHPWGTAKSPRCWGFTVDQMAALDFDKMDLSRWINSLELDLTSSSVSAGAATAMKDQATASAQSFYSAFSSGGATPTTDRGTVALITNTNTLPFISGEDFSAYTLQIVVPANWPTWFSNGTNNNPVSNVKVDWGDGTAIGTVPLASTGKAYSGRHDYGGAPAGRYTVKVTLDTAANGPQTLSTYVSITPDSGGTPRPSTIQYNNQGTWGSEQTNYTPSEMSNGASMSPAALESLSPATTDLFTGQGTSISK